MVSSYICTSFVKIYGSKCCIFWFQTIGSICLDGISSEHGKMYMHGSDLSLEIVNECSFAQGSADEFARDKLHHNKTKEHALHHQ